LSPLGLATWFSPGFGSVPIRRNPIRRNANPNPNPNPNLTLTLTLTLNPNFGESGRHPNT